jgi:hypothetical protein
MSAAQIGFQIGMTRKPSERPNRGRNRTRRELTSPAFRLTIHRTSPITPTRRKS